MSRTELVIFDFDGTLVDTAPDLISATNLFLTGRERAPLSAERIRSEIGLGLKNLLYDVYPKEGLDEAQRQAIYAEFTAIYEQEFLKSPRVFGGAERFLTEWDGQIAIVSNKRERFITPILRHLGLDRYPWARVIGGDTYPQMKPHPQPFLAAMAAAGTTPEETVIVGDGEPDVDGAVALNARAVVVDFGYASPEDLMDRGGWARIAHYDELLPLLRK